MLELSGDNTAIFAVGADSGGLDLEDFGGSSIIKPLPPIYDPPVYDIQPIPREVPPPQYDPPIFDISALPPADPIDEINPTPGPVTYDPPPPNIRPIPVYTPPPILMPPVNEDPIPSREPIPPAQPPVNYDTPIERTQLPYPGPLPVQNYSMMSMQPLDNGGIPVIAGTDVPYTDPGPVIGPGGREIYMSAPVTMSAPAGSINFALGAAVTVSSEYSSGGFPAWAAVDGIERSPSWGNGVAGSGWNSEGTPSIYSPEWMELDLGGTARLNTIVVDSVGTNPFSTDPVDFAETSIYGLTDFTVKVLTANGWVEVGSVSGNDKTANIFTFPEIDASRVRIEITGASSYLARIAEVQAWGTHVSQAAPAPVPTYYPAPVADPVSDAVPPTYYPNPTPPEYLGPPVSDTTPPISTGGGDDDTSTVPPPVSTTNGGVTTTTPPTTTSTGGETTPADDGTIFGLSPLMLAAIAGGALLLLGGGSGSNSRGSRGGGFLG